jgi:predicted methyltransferase
MEDVAAKLFGPMTRTMYRLVARGDHVLHYLQEPTPRGRVHHENLMIA